MGPSVRTQYGSNLHHHTGASEAAGRQRAITSAPGDPCPGATHPPLVLQAAQRGLEEHIRRTLAIGRHRAHPPGSCTLCGEVYFYRTVASLLLLFLSPSCSTTPVLAARAWTTAGLRTCMATVSGRVVCCPACAAHHTRHALSRCATVWTVKSSRSREELWAAGAPRGLRSWCSSEFGANDERKLQRAARNRSYGRNWFSLPLE